MSSTASNAFRAFHQPPFTAKTSMSSIEPANRKKIPASTPIDFTDVMLNRNMIIDRISQSVPVIRKIHQKLPKFSS